MNESPREYLFDGVNQSLELERLRSIETIFDRGTIALLGQVGPLTNGRCLEVGAGAGSIARWLRGQVGATGHVHAVDLDVRFLDDLPGDIRVTRGDAATLNLDGPFDWVHARFVLIHNARVDQLLQALIAQLAPGGYLALEEPDFSCAHAFAASPEQRAAFDDVNHAIQAVFERRGQRYDLGRTLPALLDDPSLELIHVESDTPVVKGGSALARMMAMSTRQLGEQYLATGRVTREQLALYAGFSEDPSGWALYHGTVRVLARKARAT